MRTILVTGGAGFIGSCFVRRCLRRGDRVVNYDRLTYAGHLESVPPVDQQHVFVHADVCDSNRIQEVLAEYAVEAVVHFAAESHVDRSIDGPAEFIRTNVNGTCSLLESCYHHYCSMSAESRAAFRFLHVSTDEVYGALGAEGVFTEDSPYAPNSPYAASKASADMFVRAFHKTYGLPTLISNCSNNYGPYQFPEKLIPLMTLNAIDGRGLPVYGDGGNVRDWLHVEDHCAALERILDAGTVGETYNVGGNSELTNLAIVEKIGDLTDQLLGRSPGTGRKLIRFVEDRPGHDWRYAVATDKIVGELDWQPQVRFDDGLLATIRWYLGNREWVQAVSDGAYDRQRLGTGRPGDD